MRWKLNNHLEGTVTRVIVIALSMCFLAGCVSREKDTLTEKNVAIAKKLFDHFNKHEWTQMAALYTDPAEFKDPSFGQEIVHQTRQQTAEKYNEMQKMSPDIRDDIVQMYPSGEKYVIVEFISSGTAPDGQKWKLPLCTIFTIENGLITRDCTYYDKE